MGNQIGSKKVRKEEEIKKEEENIKLSQQPARRLALVDLPVTD
jgi:hypothetical protein